MEDFLTTTSHHGPLFSCPLLSSGQVRARSGPRSVPLFLFWRESYSDRQTDRLNGIEVGLSPAYQLRYHWSLAAYPFLSRCPSLKKAVGKPQKKKLVFISPVVPACMNRPKPGGVRFGVRFRSWDEDDEEALTISYFKGQSHIDRRILMLSRLPSPVSRLTSSSLNLTVSLGKHKA